MSYQWDIIHPRCHSNLTQNCLPSPLCPTKMTVFKHSVTKVPPILLVWRHSWMFPKKVPSNLITNPHSFNAASLLFESSSTSKSTTSSLFVDKSSRQVSVSGETDSVVKSMQERRRRYGQEEASNRLRLSLMEIHRPGDKPPVSRA